jgi:Cft2 family RNA processing exonuclease
MPGVEKPYPHLSTTQIKTAKFLFISHSHIDHTGAYEWLCEQGFCGMVVMTKETANQVSFKPKLLCLINELTSVGNVLKLSETISVCYGKSGQCVGSVWYAINFEGENILFSGDYIEDTLVYSCDTIRNIKSDVAILDNAYGISEKNAANCRDDLLNMVNDFLTQGKNIVFPVPKYGRGFELIFLLQEHFPEVNIMADPHLKNELSGIENIQQWLKPQTLKKLQNISIKDINTRKVKNFIFVSDPQLKTFSAQKIASKIIAQNGEIIITGNADNSSFSEKLLVSGKARLFRYAVHSNKSDINQLEEKNYFQHIVPYHS